MTKSRNIGRGGKRPGSGRKPDPDRLIAIGFRTPPDIAAWLNANTKNRSAFIVAAILAEIDRWP